MVGPAKIWPEEQTSSYCRYEIHRAYNAILLVRCSSCSHDKREIILKAVLVNQ